MYFKSLSVNQFSLVQKVQELELDQYLFGSLKLKSETDRASSRPYHMHFFSGLYLFLVFFLKGMSFLSTQTLFHLLLCL